MYDCKLYKEDTEETVIFTVLANHPDMVVVDRFSQTLGAIGGTATQHEEADMLKQQYLAEGFKEI